MGDKPRITQNELMKNLVSARKIMSKVNTGDYEKGNIDESLLTRGTEELLDDETPAQPSIRPVGKADPDKIKVIYPAVDRNVFYKIKDSALIKAKLE